MPVVTSSSSPFLSSSSSSPSLPSINGPSPAATVKFDWTNYLLWKSQIVPILKSQRLYKYVDPSFVAPPSSISNPSTGESSPNPAFEDWEVIDQTLLTWINATLTDPLKAECVGYLTSCDVWLYLEHYVLNIKQISNSLASSLEPVSDLELVSTTLRGLGPDYAPFYAAITTRPTLPSFTELHALLLHYESHLSHLQQLQHHVSDLQNPTSFYAGPSHRG
ncbi:hypothetical protein BVC80_1609g3 [Macleaya cordata]|uniref:Retrotransposon Copia-like N-terminal domain-containing protein n=1 Tax=Macleaya cordata TaxID=56857 RepID=A0A200Q9V7_MACCD|nr:hypothetical protein BVC80_1609g3 [Macleaya cordata]